MNMKRISIILIITILMSLVGCSTNTNSINLDVDNLQFKKDIGEELGSDFAMDFLFFVCDSIEWYNSFIEDKSGDIPTIDIKDIMDKITSNKLNKTEKEIAVKAISLSTMASIIVLSDARIEKEEMLRDKNIGELSEDKYNENITEQSEHIEKIKSDIENILELYFE